MSRRFLHVLSFLASAALTATSASAAPARPAADFFQVLTTSQQWHAKPSSLVALNALREGNKVIFFRHAKTNQLERDGDRVVYSDCATQRNLSPAGRALSVEMGEAWQRLGIPVGRIVSSPYCRARETAELAFGRTELSEDLVIKVRNSVYDFESAVAGVKALAGERITDGTNTVLVAHILNAEPAFRVRLEEGEGLVMQPRGNGRVRVIGTISMTQWGDLTRDLVVGRRRLPGDPSDVLLQGTKDDTATRRERCGRR